VRGCAAHSYMFLCSLAMALYGQRASSRLGVALGLLLGDTISADNLRIVIEHHLVATGQPRSSVRFDIGGSLLDWDAAMAWVNDGRREGFNLVRYILREQPSGALIVNLAAIRNLDSNIEPDAV
jgi:hypothetical protein